jgi:hypothetical protein
LQPTLVRCANTVPVFLANICIHFSIFSIFLTNICVPCACSLTAGRQFSAQLLFLAQSSWKIKIKLKIGIGFNWKSLTTNTIFLQKDESSVAEP